MPPINDSATVFETRLTHLPCVQRGKVRDLYELGANEWLMVATDRLSAFDVVLPTPVPGKGCALTAISAFWFEHLREVVPNHSLGQDLDDLSLTEDERDLLKGRSLRIRRLQPLPIEAVVRGYLVGSGWTDYQRDGQVCGIPLPEGLRLGERLAEPLFTPATKAAVGDHDENINFDEAANLVGAERAHEVRELSLQLYEAASTHAMAQGIIIADTKFEFGVDEHDALVLIDEVLTPDSSRFWEVVHWRPGRNPDSFDKQFVRDWLQEQQWDKLPPAPELPPEVVRGTTERYMQIGRRLCGESSMEF